jgi:hypothetical protein
LSFRFIRKSFPREKIASAFAFAIIICAFARENLFLTQRRRGAEGETEKKVGKDGMTTQGVDLPRRRYVLPVIFLCVSALESLGIVHF